MEKGYSSARTQKPIAARALAEVRRIVNEMLKEKGVSVYLFGSWARGEATHCSDIDLAIESKSNHKTFVHSSGKS